ncbi:VIT1/CCC1 transporter family protein [Litorisediminicola beolgyonensis]|uniref:VIT1/CCC1 transporter family protein n=1 Tax=Litorisediminicola beolgyonensis TaxID=1173614 RepID=A0ABW3ZF53_9RHOB
MSDTLTDPGDRLSGVQRYLKPIIYGGNDGIVTTFAIVAGFAGASAEGAAQIGGLAVLVFGLANLFADAVSMGMGEFLSARSKGQLYARERKKLCARLAVRDGEAAAGLEALFRQRGLNAEDAAALAEAMARAPDLSVELLLAERLGPSDPEADGPATNGLITFAAFVGFGTIPLLPYILREADALSTRLSLVATFAALALLGLVRRRATGETARRALGETLAVGGLCAGVAYAVGWLVGG